MRPSMLRDYDNRRLPNNPTARVLFVVICLFTYVTLVLCFQSFGEFARKISSLIFPAFIHNFVDTFRDQAPLLGAVTLGALLQFSFFRDLERSLLVWLHSARHLHRDSINLCQTSRALPIFARCRRAREKSRNSPPFRCLSPRRRHQRRRPRHFPQLAESCLATSPRS